MGVRELPAPRVSTRMACNANLKTAAYPPAHAHQEKSGSQKKQDRNFIQQIPTLLNKVPVLFSLPVKAPF